MIGSVNSGSDGIVTGVSLTSGSRAFDLSHAHNFTTNPSVQTRTVAGGIGTASLSSHTHDGTTDSEFILVSHSDIIYLGNVTYMSSV